MNDRFSNPRLSYRRNQKIGWKGPRISEIMTQAFRYAKTGTRPWLLLFTDLSCRRLGLMQVTVPGIQGSDSQEGVCVQKLSWILSVPNRTTSTPGNASPRNSGKYQWIIPSLDSRWPTANFPSLPKVLYLYGMHEPSYILFFRFIIHCRALYERLG